MRGLLRLVGWLAAGVGLLAWSWLWFCPVGGFHHMVRCGVLGWAILDGENGEPAVRWSALALVLSAVGWHVGVALAASVAHAVTRGRRRAAAMLAVDED